MTEWLASIVGNSRLHWGWFQGSILKAVWDSEHLSVPPVGEQLPEGIFPPDLAVPPRKDLPVYIASVVPSQTALWQAYPQARVIQLGQIPLPGIYPTLGIDRALAVWGAGKVRGFPCLVVDAGTALTFTGASGDGVLVGGAILPGLRLQLQSLAVRTAQLPEVNLPEELPDRWNLTTSGAMESGVIYTVLAGIADFVRDWQERYGGSHLLLTGGDSNLLLSYLTLHHPELAAKVEVEPHLIFFGMRSLFEDKE